MNECLEAGARAIAARECGINPDEVPLSVWLLREPHARACIEAAVGKLSDEDINELFGFVCINCGHIPPDGWHDACRAALLEALVGE